ncbi:MAG: hypothetical protein ACP5I6_04650 [Caldisphaera sp.]|jgi:hypothetical protein|nr:MAG: hypothetical protein C0201_04310 [Caldisphaera sp.]
MKCEICDEKEAKYECKICKRKVCEDDYNKNKGICKICSSLLCEICHERLSITFCPICGRLICDKDSVQIDNVRRVCIDCYNKYFKGKLFYPNNSSKYINGAIRLAKRVIKT